MGYKSLLFCVALFTTFLNVHSADNQSKLITVAESDYQWTGVAVSKEGRIFVNYPTWKVPSPYKVAELVDGKEVVYPSERDDELFVCVQSVVVDKKNRLWVLDTSNPQFKGIVGYTPVKGILQSGPILYQIDLNLNKIVNTYYFDESTYTASSYFNDVRIDTEREIAYITDSKDGGIVALDLRSGESWLALNHNCDAVMANLDGIDFKDTGKSRGITNSDGIELSEDGQMLYFAALTGNILYQIPTVYLRDDSLSSDYRCSKVEVLNKNNVPTDGMVLLNNKLYMGNLPDASLWCFDIATQKGTSFNFGTTIRWADSFAIGADGYVYFTTSQINYPEVERVKYGLFKFKPE